MTQATTDNKISGTPLSNGVFYGEQKTLDSTSTLSLKVGLFVFSTISLNITATLMKRGGEGKALSVHWPVEVSDAWFRTLNFS